jgi:hypothetical protein
MKLPTLREFVTVTFTLVVVSIIGLVWAFSQGITKELSGVWAILFYGAAWLVCVSVPFMVIGVMALLWQAYGRFSKRKNEPAYVVSDDVASGTLRLGDDGEIVDVVDGRQSEVKK